MDKGAAWARGCAGDWGGRGGWRWLVASHPPPDLPPGRGEGLNWGGGIELGRRDELGEGVGVWGVGGVDR